MDYMLYFAIVVRLKKYFYIFFVIRIHCILHEGNLVQDLQSFRKSVTIIMSC